MYNKDKSSIVIFTGKSSSGKDNSKLYALLNYNIEQAVACTTRPMRSNEQEGFDYYFISQEAFSDAINSNKFLEYRQYDTKLGVWYYGTKLEAFDETKSYIMIKDLYGAIELKHKLQSKFNVIIVYISRPDSLRRLGAELRDANFSELEWERRLHQDDKDFTADLLKTNCDYFINNCLDESDLHTEIDIIMNNININRKDI